MPDYYRNFVTAKHREHDLSSLKRDVTRREHLDAAADRAARDEGVVAAVQVLRDKWAREDRLREAAEQEERERLARTDVDLYEMRRRAGDDWRP